FDKQTYEGTLTQALIQLNGRLVAGGSTALPASAVANVAHADMTDAQRVEALYLRTLSRRPTRDELDGWTKYLASPPPLTQSDPPKAKGSSDPLARVTEKIPETRDPKVAAIEDLMWTLLNSSEFVLNH